MFNFNANEMKSVYEKSAQAWVDGLVFTTNAMRDGLALQANLINDCMTVGVQNAQELQKVQSPKDLESFVKATQKASEQLWQDSAEKLSSFYQGHVTKYNSFANATVATVKNEVAAKAKV